MPTYDAIVLDTMTADAGAGATDANVIKVMGAGSSMSLGFTATPLTGNNALGVKFTDGTVVAAENVQDAMGNNDNND